MAKLKYILIICLAFTLLSIFILGNAASGQQNDSYPGPVHLIELEGTISAGKMSYLQRQFDIAFENNAQLIIVVMNTPGGLVDATLEINRLFLNAPVPVAVLVAPSGAIAGSAGAFILLSSDIAAMAPGTTVGAAQPITFSPEGTSPANEKTVIFYASHLRSMAEEKGRPAELAEKFVTENLTMSSREALELGIIEYIANSTEDLLKMLDGSSIRKDGETYTLDTEAVPISSEEMNLRERLQSWLSDPQIAFLILMAGLLGIYFGLNAPGTIVPEVSGLILVILGIYGIGLFDTNTTGIILIIVGAGLLIAEIFTSGFGILGIGGSLSMVAGAILLPVEPLMARQWYATFLVTVVGTIIGLLIVTIFVAHRVLKSRKKWREGSAFFHPPLNGITVTELNPEGMIKARGELWKAKSVSDQVIPANIEVEVVRAESLNLWVKPAENKKP